MKQITIKPQSGWTLFHFQEWIEFWDLFLILILRDIKLRYKQTLLGVLWVVLQPLLTCCVFAVIFGRIAKVPSDGIPYILFALGGMLPWFLFSQSVLRASQSIITQAHMITKIYFPRIMLPAASCSSTLIDFSVNLITILVLCPVYGIPYSFKLLCIPLLCFVVMLFTLGLGLIFSALNVFYRDVGNILPFFLQIWMFASPLVYSANMVPEKWKFIYMLNPIAGMIDAFRWSLFDMDTFPLQSVLTAVFSSIITCLFGLLVFNRIEKQFVDVI